MILDDVSMDDVAVDGTMVDNVVEDDVTVDNPASDGATATVSVLTHPAGNGEVCIKAPNLRT